MPAAVYLRGGRGLVSGRFCGRMVPRKAVWHWEKIKKKGARKERGTGGRATKVTVFLHKKFFAQNHLFYPFGNQVFDGLMFTDALADVGG